MAQLCFTYEGMSKRSDGRPLWREASLHIWRFRWLIDWLMQDGRVFIGFSWLRMRTRGWPPIVHTVRNFQF